MATSDADRLHLYNVARDRWDDEDAAATLMKLLPSDSDQLATKDDLALQTETLRREMAEHIGGLRADMVEQRGDLAAQIGSLRADMVEQRGDLAAQIGSLRADMVEQRGHLAAQIGGLRADMTEQRGDVAAQIGGLRAEMLEGFSTQSRMFLLALMGAWLTLLAVILTVRVT